jgi:hypothetical protein
MEGGQGQWAASCGGAASGAVRRREGAMVRRRRVERQTEGGALRNGDKERKTNSRSGIRRYRGENGSRRGENGSRGRALGKAFYGGAGSMKNAEASSTRSSVPLLVSAEVRFLRHMAETSRKEARPFYFSPFFGGGLSPLPSYSCIGLRSAVPGLHPRQLYLPACHFCAGSSSCHFGASSSIPDFGVGSSFSHRRASSSISHFGAGSSISRSWCRSCSSCSRSLSWNPGWSNSFCSLRFCVSHRAFSLQVAIFICFLEVLVLGCKCNRPIQTGTERLPGVQVPLN